MMRAVLAFSAVIATPSSSIAQRQESPVAYAAQHGFRRASDVDTIHSTITVEWLAPTLLLGAALVADERIRPIALANRSPLLDRVASGADVLGTAGHIVPALVLTYAGARVSGKEKFATATLRVALSYFASDAIEASLKPIVGRARPDLGREPLTFRPLNGGGAFQSFPSAHEVHISSLVTAAAEETRRPWMNALAAIAITYVGAQRIYRDQHWTSDVVASGILGVDLARLTEGWLHARSQRARGDVAPP